MVLGNIVNEDWKDAIPEAKAKEWVSLAYIQGICAQAGLNILHCEWDDGVDLHVGATKAVLPHARRNQFIALQVKSTTQWAQRGEDIRFRLAQKAYNDLRKSSTCAQYLVLYTLPRQRSQWIVSSDDRNEFLHKAYYLDLSIHPDNTNTRSTTVSIPVANELTSCSLVQLFLDEITRWTSVA